MKISEEQIETIEDVFDIHIERVLYGDDVPCVHVADDYGNCRLWIPKAVPKLFHDFCRLKSAKSIIGDFKYLPYYKFCVECIYGHVRLVDVVIEYNGGYDWEGSLDEYFLDVGNRGEYSINKELSVVIKRYFWFNFIQHFQNQDKLDILKSILQD